jgi:hypothetical protein
MWWGLYVIRVSDRKQLDHLSRRTCVIENIDAEGLLFVVKDMQIIDPIPINGGAVPCLHGVAEITEPPQPPWYHIGLSKHRKATAKKVEELSRFSTEVLLCVSLLPFKTLIVCHDSTVIDSDDVYIAIVKARASREEKRKNKQ